jgi:hypothetical protein
MEWGITNSFDEQPLDARYNDWKEQEIKKIKTAIERLTLALVA